MDIGQALAGLGDDVAAGILRSKKEKELYDMQLQRAEALGRMGIKGGQVVMIDPNVKDKDIIPFMNQKALDDIKTNASHNRAQKMGELKAYTDIGIVNMRNQLMQAQRLQSNPRTQEPAYPGGPVRDIPQTQAYAADLQRQAAVARGQKEARQEARAARGEQRAEQHLDIAKSGLQMRGQAAREQWIAAQPETKLFKETGISPQVFLRPESREAGYTAVQKATGNPVGEFAPLSAGQTLKDLPKPPTWADYLWHTVVKNREAKELDPNIEFVPKAGGAFREAQYTYSASKDKPKETRYVPHPEGEFLRIGEKRVPYQDAVSVLGMMERRRKDAQDALKTLPLPTIQQRLGDLGYDPNDPFWGLPQTR